MISLVEAVAVFLTSNLGLGRSVRRWEFAEKPVGMDGKKVWGVSRLKEPESSENRGVRPGRTEPEKISPRPR